MSRFKPWVALALITCCLITPVVSSANAGVEPSIPPAQLQSAVGGESWVGGVAAIGCGLFTRATIVTGGAFVGTIAGAVACCALMILDGVYN